MLCFLFGGSRHFQARGIHDSILGPGRAPLYFGLGTAKPAPLAPSRAARDCPRPRIDFRASCGPLSLRHRTPFASHRAPPPPVPSMRGETCRPTVFGEPPRWPGLALGPDSSASFETAAYSASHPRHRRFSTPNPSPDPLPYSLLSPRPGGSKSPTSHRASACSSRRTRLFPTRMTNPSTTPATASPSAPSSTQSQT